MKACEGRVFPIFGSAVLIGLLMVLSVKADPPAVSPLLEDYTAICAAVEAGTIADRRCFYVSNIGDDNLDGRTANDAWQTIGKVNSVSFQPGDIIQFKRGDVWRLTGQYDALSVSASGENERWITYGAYGAGDNPRILGSTQAASWTNVGGYIWMAATEIPLNPITIYYGAQLFFEGAEGAAQWGHYETYTTDFAALDNEYDWTWYNKRVYVHAPEDPATRYRSVEAPQSRRLIQLNDNSYVAFDSLTLRYMVNAGIYDVYNTSATVSGLRATNSEIGYIGIRNSSSAYGLALRRTNIYVGYNTIHDCGRRAISLNLYSDTPPFTMQDILIEYNHFYGGYHTTGVDASAGTASSGRHVIRDMTIRNNRFDGNPDYDIEGEDGYGSNQIWMYAGDTALVENTDIIGNLFVRAHGSGAKLAGGNNYRIYNNTFYDFNRTLTTYQAQVYLGADVTEARVINNIFVNNAETTRQACIRIEEGNQAQYTIDYNLYHSETGARMLWGNGSPRQYAVTDWDLYQEDNPDYDAHSPHPADPQFVLAPDDFGLRGTSPATGAALQMEGLVSDTLGNPDRTPVDLGAVQSGVWVP